ncbi:hypothetical protein H310_04102 [Aphanomyces invadans]|uniref:Uncharacterized protein n=1 Tax=Aphanomyces invadans TaxID=157072 RepID=A0A024UGR7_9STRA|nr:hypothetical protein H310_04102 [Aphanomyces invadans]ETW05067.1 hypothetical protein H310_04102 [Aphanomyces invadans]|eukprot:XP_008866505.1 hypothetical protein H310_04102 [Aphanomyces invadans]
MTRPSTDERAVVIAKSLAFGDSPTPARSAPTAGPHRQRIRHAKVCRGRVAFSAPDPEAISLSSNHAPPSRQRRPRPKSPRVESSLISLLETTSAPQERPHPIHVTIVDNIRARKRTSGLRTAQAVTAQNGLLPGDEGASTGDLTCRDPLEDSLSPHVEDTLAPLVSPNNSIFYSQTQRATWSGQPSPGCRRSRQPSTTTPMDVSDAALSSYSGDVSAHHVVAEIDTIKAILIREQLLERIGRAAVVIDRSVLELHGLTKLHRRRSSGNTTSRNEDNNDGDERPSASQKKEAEGLIATLENRIAAATKDVLELAPDLRMATVKVTDAIEHWRHAIDDDLTRTNRPHHVREFVFQRANYLEKMSHDMRTAYDGVALSAIFNGPPHPFLLPHDQVENLHASLGLPRLPSHGASTAHSTTFLTTSALVADRLTDLVTTVLHKRLPSIQQNNRAVIASTLTADIRRATKAIFHEHDRVHSPPCIEPPAYDPFDMIRQYPTVADAFESMCRVAQDTLDENRETLRRRQQDTTRARAQVFRSAPTPLIMNTAVVDTLVATKRAAETPSIVASKPTSSTRSKNRLAGQVLTRKKFSRSGNDPVLRSVMKIQAQFRRRKSRLEILVSLKTLSRQLHQAATNIQRIYRGHRAKAIVGQVQLSVWAEARSMDFNARRLQRWARKRWSERMQATKRQVAATIVEKPIAPKGPSQTELYREAGRQRRMERDRAAAERRVQAALLLEKQRLGCSVIQGAFRQYNKRKTIRMLQVARRAAREFNAATHIQAFIRCTLAKMYARQLRERRQLDTVHYSSTLIQATYRGHRVRQRMSLAAALAASKHAGSPTKTKLPAVGLKPAVLKPQPTRPTRRQSTVTVPKPLQSPRDRLPSLVQPGPRRRKSGVSWEELKLKEPRIGDQL